MGFAPRRVRLKNKCFLTRRQSEASVGPFRDRNKYTVFRLAPCRGVPREKKTPGQWRDALVMAALIPRGRDRTECVAC